MDSGQSRTDDAPTAALLEALRFAAQRHRFQRRKDRERTPYVNHLIDVAQMLAAVGGVRDETVLLAAVLHDTVEDTETTPDELRERFGAAVRDVVLEVTDDKALPKAERKRLQILNAPRVSARAKLVKLADKICNVRDIAESPPEGWSVERRAEYFDWAERVIAGVRGTNAALERRFDEMVAAARASLAGAEAAS